MNYFIYAISGIGLLWLLWVFFLAVMALKRAKDDGLLVKGCDAYYIALSVLFVGYLIDLIVNLTVATILFAELPFELTVTARITRHKKFGGWRGDLARWMCSKLLDPYQIGGHCT